MDKMMNLFMKIQEKINNKFKRKFKNGSQMLIKQRRLKMVIIWDF